MNMRRVQFSGIESFSRKEVTSSNIIFTHRAHTLGPAEEVREV